MNESEETSHSLRALHTSTLRACMSPASATVQFTSAHVSVARFSRTARPGRAVAFSAVDKVAPTPSRQKAHPARVSRVRAHRSRASATSADAEGNMVVGNSPPVHRRASGVLAIVNESTKFVVASIALAFLLVNPSVDTCWALLGSVVNSVNGKILKRILNHERPDGAVKADPGMPSSHATSLSYLSVYGAASLVYFKNAAPMLGYPLQLACATVLVVLGVFLSYLRVRLGYHTAPQVIVGYALGSSTALVWLASGVTRIFPLLAENPEMLRVLHSVLIIAIGWFAVSALKWVEDVTRWVKAKMK